MSVAPERRADAVVALMARHIEDGAVVATGVASPLAILAIALARATWAPNLTYLACVGALDPTIERLHRSSEHLAYLDGRRGNVSIADLFDHARRGRVDTIFFGAAEVDGDGQTNMSTIGDIRSPHIKLPGVAGASTLRRWTKRPVVVVPRQGKRSLVPRVQFVTTSDNARVTPLITNLGVFEVGPQGATLVARHAWTTDSEIADKTGFAYRAASTVRLTESADRETSRILDALDPEGLRQRAFGFT